MNRGEMRSQIRIMLGETKQDGYKDDEINTQINTSCLLVARDLLSLKTFRDISVVAYNDPTLTDPEDPRKTGRYSLPDDFLSMISVTITDGSTRWPLVKMENEEYDNAVQTTVGGRPSYYKMEFGSVSLTAPKAGDLWLYPYPDGNYTLRRTYYQKPTPMALDTDTSELPEPAHFAACCHAAMTISRKFKDRALIGEMADMYYAEEGRLKRWAEQQDNTGPRFMRARV